MPSISAPARILLTGKFASICRPSSAETLLKQVQPDILPLMRSRTYSKKASLVIQILSLLNIRPSDRFYLVVGTVRSATKGKELSKLYARYRGRFSFSVVPDITKVR